MINREQQPTISKIEKIQFLAPKHFEIKDEVKLHLIDAVDDESVKVDFIFNAGTKNDQVHIAGFVSALLLSGTQNSTASEINEKIDGLGGFFQADASREAAYVTVYGLRKNIQAILEIVLDALSSVSFPQEEIDQLIERNKQEFNVSSEKVSFLARRAFGKALFEGTEYEKQVEFEQFDTVKREQLVNFHKQFYLNGLEKVCVTANLSEELVFEIIQNVKDWKNKHPKNYVELTKNTAKKIHIEKEGAIQTAIRIGRVLFTRKNNDYLDFSVLNLILGGYFGSRLMSNIREDKGYTYGIGSGVMELNATGYFFISTEVGKDVAEDAISEIKKEVERLQIELVSKEELELVKNYAIGQLLQSSDGPNAMMDRFLSIDKFGMDYDYYEHVIQTFNEITPDRIQQMAKKYLNWNELLVVTAG